MADRLNRDTVAELDAADPLAANRALFSLPDGTLYFDGNSLGALPLATKARLDLTINDEWGRGLIGSWNTHDWIGLPLRMGAKVARLVGAQSDEVVVTDSTSINLFKLMAAGLAMRPGRSTILSEEGNFPTDLYIGQGLAALMGEAAQFRLVPAGGIESRLDDDVAVVVLSEIEYRSGRIRDMTRVTKAVHDAGALVLWDLSHSVGVLPIDLAAAQADFAVGCTYKFLNGGPGSPAFLYVATSLHDDLRNPLSGWMGHAAPFQFDDRYQPASGLRRMLCGTPPILSMVALDAALDVALSVDLAAVREKAKALTSLFIELVEAKCQEVGFVLSSPRAADERGAQVSFRHDDGYPIMQALIERGVVGDFRAPDILRFGFAPLYLRYVDVWDAVERLAEIMTSAAWDRPEFHLRRAVT